MPKKSVFNAPSVVKWMTVEEAAETMSVTAEALRARLRRSMRRASDGGIEADIDGVRARKFGRSWRVVLGAAWSEPVSAGNVERER